MIRSRFVVAAALAASLVCAGDAHAGPCTAKIAELEQQIGMSGAGPSGLGIPRNAGSTENASAAAALDRAKQADAEGNAAVCNRELDIVRRIFGIN